MTMRVLAPKFALSRASASENRAEIANLSLKRSDSPKPTVSYQKQIGYTKMALLLQTTLVHNSCTS
jgi:hypothetical protein